MAKTVLVIDDDPGILTMMRDSLRGSGLDVYLAGNGEVGMELFDIIHPDLAIVDIVMPVKEGVSVIIDIKHSLFETPVIAISGGGFRETKDYLHWAKELGADATLQKPFRMSTLLMIAQQLLEEAAHPPSRQHPALPRYVQPPLERSY